METESPTSPGSPPAPTPDPARSLEGARFIPGQMLAGRYRIVERIGKGGMGEVYRAEDLKLGQPVALKFLPPELGVDPGALEAFLTEVRIAREISHPNVCRVYDIDEVDGMHFLSMEFVDGEDLGTLLRRIGRLPADKATEIAIEICAGLAAIHDRGVLHRDLKPANVMVDGRGHARITDFGLAALQGSEAGMETIVGTPAYMARECLVERRAPTLRSDLYSLGLVLYEVFTGRHAFAEVGTFRDLVRVRRDTTPESPTRLQPDVDSGVERVILRCLEADPERRPASARAVAAALPGGDPLAAAIAAGETPSPELVAASMAGDQGLRPATAWTLLAALAAGLLLVTAWSPSTRVVPRLRLAEPPEAMASRAREVLADLGFRAVAADRSYGYRFEESTVEYMMFRDRSASRWEALSRPRPPAATFWYRQSPTELVPADRWGRVHYSDPPLQQPGMVGVQLDGLGRLRRLDAAPPAATSPAASGTLELSALFRLAGLDTADFEAIAPSAGPAGASADSARSPSPQPVGDASGHRVFAGHYAEVPGHPVRVEAELLRGRPVSFRVEEPWMRPAGESAEPLDPSGRITSLVSRSVRPALFLAAMFIGVWLARRNLRAGRGDLKRALRVAGAMLGLRVLIWLLGGHLTAGSLTEQARSALAWGLYDAAYGWIFYVAIEPYVRRLWPRMLTSWVRLLDGRHEDPRVGRDLLIGCLLGTVIALAVAGHQAAPLLFGGPPGRPDNVGYVEHQLSALLGLRFELAEMFYLFRSNLVLVMGFVVILVTARIVLRNAAAAMVATFVLFVPLALPKGELFALNLGLAVAATLLVLVTLMRFGLLAATVGLLSYTTLQSAPMGMDLGSWPASRTLLVLVLLLGVGAYGFARSLGGRPAIRDVLADG